MQAHLWNVSFSSMKQNKNDWRAESSRGLITMRSTLAARLR